MWNRTEDKIKAKITWIRHGMTQANGEHRYLGKTDEPLSETGIRLLQEKKKEYFSSPPEFLYTSPMKRCVQTAELLFERNPILIPEWKEMDFGQFEGKNYEELKDNPCYHLKRRFLYGRRPKGYVIRSICQWNNVHRKLLHDIRLH